MIKNFGDGGKSGVKAETDDIQNIIDKNIGIKRLPDQQLRKKPSILLMRNEWTTYSSVGVQRKILEVNTEKIKNFINSLTVPSWYRGLSLFQQKAADRLRYAIREDNAQRTVHRTMKCLESIGLDPLPTTKQLYKILPLSGGNDLALLWFLMEWLYTDNDSDSYSVNEQLIMSSIAHLDMIATLHELDRILPPRQDSKAKKVLPKKSKNLQNKSKIQKSERALPYFQNLPQRRPTKPHSLKASKNQKKTSTFHPYDFIDKSYAVLNGDHRWFQDNNFEGNGGAINNNQSKEIRNLLESFEAAMVEESKANEMCGHQQNIEYIKKSFDTELNAIARQTSEELEQIFEGKQQNYERLIIRLDQDIEKCRKEFHSIADNYHRLLASKHHGDNGKESALFLNNCVAQIGPTTDERDKQLVFDKNKCSSQNSSPTLLNVKPCEAASEPEYFVFSQTHQPLNFNYCKIFSWDTNHSECVKNPTTAVDAIESFSSEKENVCKHDEKIDGDINVVDYGLDFYDPEDDELMDRMLADALNIMRKKDKFVFASIPAAHRFPMLREWIRSRYGKKYNRADLSRCFEESKSIFVALAKVGLPVELPSNDDMGSNLATNYFCRDYVLHKARLIRNQFYNRINKAMLAQSRVIYLAMRHCDRVQSYNTLFAYMPAHKREIYHFRPWKLGESMKQTQLGSFDTMQHEIATVKRPSYKSELK